MRGADPEPARFRRCLRGSQTEAERRLRCRLRDRRLGGAEVVRQESIRRSVAEFDCRTSRLIGERNGDHHADSDHGVRAPWLTAQGSRVLGFWNVGIVNTVAGVRDTILSVPPPSHRLPREGRDDPVVGTERPKGEGEGAASVKPQLEPPPHPRLPPRCDDTVVASLSPQAGSGEIQR
ncbi:DUF559 domain-containing protein [Methylobacterium sp. 092160098-2]|uniref:DUF559 domain-containing protein n=1 Tax=Methylobacterium TaxID=407 RepID=UPI000F9F47DB|nr:MULTISPECIES: DUF559 domain-containing protein [unclassified Methylobacterium]MDE4912910.1 DUF559 domain-containing protein [Methylobacterium sp. 092160098-2]RUP15428.1 MAG: DUF559 domain-containing protein [Methylobacterium sp.]